MMAAEQRMTTIDAFDQLDERRIVQFIEAQRGIDHHIR